MDAAAVKEYLVDFQKKGSPSLISRELQITPSKKIQSIIGPRRAGKTYFQYQQMHELLGHVPKEHLLYLNFEDPRLIDLKFTEIQEVVKLYWTLYPSSTKAKLFLFIDEPQNIDRWEIAIRSLHDEGFPLFLTGSSAKLLGKEIASSLRGRTLTHTLLPFSFREFLHMRNQSFDLSRLGSREKSLLLGLLDEYLTIGGFPEVVLEQDGENKVRILNEYYNLVVFRDIVERYNIRNTRLIKWLIRTLTRSFAKEFSTHKIYNILASQGFHLSKNTLYSYVSMLEDSLFIFVLPKFSYSVRKRDFSQHKVYLCDVGFSMLTDTSPNKGPKMENTVFLDLERQKNPLTEIFYWKNIQQEEVDFVLTERGKVKQLIQVCYHIDDLDVKKRELRALVKASEELCCQNLMVITEDKEGTERSKGKKILYIPLWKWLLTKK